MYKFNYDLFDFIYITMNESEKFIILLLTKEKKLVNFNILYIHK